MPSANAKNAGEPPQNSECAYGDGKKRCGEYETRRRGRGQSPRTTCSTAIRETGVRRLVKQHSNSCAAKDKCRPGKETEARIAGQRPDVRLDPIRHRVRASESTARLALSMKQHAAAAANTIDRATVDRDMRAQMNAATMIDGPMMFRMSTLNSDRAAPRVQESRLEHETTTRERRSTRPA